MKYWSVAIYDIFFKLNFDVISITDSKRGFYVSMFPFSRDKVPVRCDFFIRDDQARIAASLGTAPYLRLAIGLVAIVRVTLIHCLLLAAPLFYPPYWNRNLKITVDVFVHVIRISVKLSRHKMPGSLPKRVTVTLLQLRKRAAH